MKGCRARIVVLSVLASLAIALVVVAREGCSDTPEDVRLAAIFGAAGFLASMVYVVLERDPIRASRVHSAGVTFLRLFLAFMFVQYGFAKIIGMQFYPRYYLLDARVADIKPMNLAWTFFGRSLPYQVFMGAIELGGALLLCTRRTVTLGACILLAVATNIVALNFSYDICVKLGSSIYLAMASYLVSTNIRLLASVFVGTPPLMNRQDTNAADAAQRSTGTRPLLWACLVAMVVGYPVWKTSRQAMQHRLFVEEPLLGAWSVEERVGLDELTAETPGAWDRVYFEKGDYGFIRIDKTRLRFETNVDLGTHTIELGMANAKRATAKGAYALNGNVLTIEGAFENRPFSLRLRRDLGKP